MVDTSDDWIEQRTGIRERHVCRPERGEGTLSLSIEALEVALADANLKGSDLDLVIVSTVTGEMSCPSTACRVASAVGAIPAGAFDISAACPGYVYAMSLADSLIRTGRYGTIAVVSADTISQIADKTDRRMVVLFGDAAGATILRRDDDPSVGCRYQTLQSDGSRWAELYIPRDERHAPPGADWNTVKLGCLQMNGPEVYRFALQRIQECLVDLFEHGNVTIDDIRMLIVHQSNARMIENAKRRLRLPDEKVYMNIDRFGNTSSASIPLAFHELWREDKLKHGDLLAFVAFGGGLTWGSALWQL